jgi:PKD repeat protein
MLDNSGNMWCWGDNAYGEVGNGATGGSVSAPYQITVDSLGHPFTNIIQIVPAASNYGYLTGAVKSDGTVWVWGDLGGGNRGNGSAGKNVSRPVQVTFPAGTFIRKIQLGSIGIALDSAGGVWTWGGNYGYPTNYILAQGTTSPSTNLPKKISLPGKARDISGGDLWNYAILRNNSVYGWGVYTSYLGIGNSGFMAQAGPSLNPQLLDAQLNFPSPVQTIWTSSVCSYALLQDGTLWAWGDNSMGSIGNGVQLNFATYTSSPAPTGGTPAPYAWDWGFGELMQQKPVHIGNGLTFTHLFTDKGAVFYAYAEDAAGNLYSWGRNKSGVCGNGVVEGDNSGTIASQYPNSWDIPWMTKVDPFALTKTSPTSSPWCTSHVGFPCLAEVIPVTPNPTVSAGPTQNITGSSTTLNGSATGALGSIINYYVWTQVSGPSTALITLPSGAVATASGLVTGTYVFQLKVTDNNWRTNTSQVTVNVNINPHQNPLAKAGADQTITLPANSVTLNGSASSDPNTGGSITAYQWKVLSGPAGSALSAATSATTTFSGLVHGVYSVQLTVTNNYGLTAMDTVLVTVNLAAPPPLQPLVAKAGADQSIQLPANSVALDGSGSTDPNTGAGPMSYQWKVLSGPAGSAFSAGTSAKTNLTGLVAGTYKVSLTVSDTLGLSGTDTVVITVAAAHLNPVANAGHSFSITLPVNSTTVDGSASSDPNTGGSITGYQWTVLSGPAGYTVANATSAQVSLSNLSHGAYMVQLTVTDNFGLTNSTTIQIVVNNAAVVLQPLVAKAGADQSIQLPTSSVALDGSASTDPNAGGGPMSYQWSVLSGPAGSSFSAATSAKTNLSGLAAGTYKVSLTVTDTLGLSGTDTVVITVAAAHLNPIANAGHSFSITLPTNTTSIDGSASSDPNPGGSITGYQWTVLSGPAGYTVTNATSAQVNLGSLSHGAYIVQLTVTDNYGLTGSATIQLVVNNAVPLQPVVANAGGNQSVQLPTSSVSLDGSASSDPNAGGGGLSYQWSVLSGPAGSTLSAATSAQANLSGLVAGAYTVALTVSDALGVTASDTITVTVTAAHLDPVANAGHSFSITLPTNSTTIDGSASSDPNTGGSITGYQWTVLSGPAGYSVTNATSAQVTLSSLVHGAYMVRLTVTDNYGLSNSVVIQVVVNSASVALLPVTANAGSDQTVQLPLNSVSLDGSGSSDGNTDGGGLSYQWTVVSGPAGSALSAATSAKTTLSGLMAGVYTVQLTVIDTLGVTATDTVVVTVLAAHLPPLSDAGVNQTITLPVSSVSLDGSSSSDPNTGGSIIAYNWMVVGGPAGYSFSAATGAKTTLSGLVRGQYTMKLVVTDNYGLSASSTMTVTVNAAASLSPLTANAGGNKTIQLPVNSTTLDASASSDPNADGGGLSYQWTVLNGTGPSTLSNPNGVQTDLSGLVEGTYTVQLTITDTLGLSASTTITVDVERSLNLLVANAGQPQTIQLPTSSVTLDGSGSADGNGTITSYLWSLISGPNQYNLQNNDQVQAQVTNMEVGTYTFVLTVTDNNGNSATDTVKVNVLPADPKAPVAVISNTDTVVNLTSSLNQTGYLLDGSGSFAPAGDSITTYLWQEVSGPTTVDVQTAFASQTSVSNLAEGVYQFELTVTDGEGEQSTAYLNLDVVANAPEAVATVVKIYPNPVQSTLNVWLNPALSGKIAMRVYNTQGRLVQSTVYDKQPQTDATTTMDVSMLPSGAYFLQLQGDGHVTALPFIKLP